MADEEVVIKVRQEAQGNALSESAQKIEQLKAKLAEMRALEKSYTEKGLPTAAASVRQEQIPYARELRDLQREERQHQAQLARAEKERHAAAKAEVRERITAERQASKDSDSGGFLGTLGGVNGIAQALTPILGFFKLLQGAQIEASRRSAEIAAHASEASNRTGRISGIGGARGETLAGGDFHANRAAAEALQDQAGTFHGIDGGFFDQFKQGMKERFGVENLFGLDMETDAARAERENAEKSAYGKNAANLAAVAARQQFMKGPGGDELARRKAVLDGHMKEAWALQYKIGLEKEYHRVHEATGNAALAMEAAELQGREQIRNRQMAIGASLVNARSGGRDIARAANFAGRQDAILEQVLATMKTQHAEAIGASTKKDFAGKPYYPTGS